MSGASICQSSDHSPTGQGGPSDAFATSRRIAYELVPGLTVRPVSNPASLAASGFTYEVHVSWDLAERLSSLMAPLLPLFRAVETRAEMEDLARRNDHRRARSRLHMTVGLLASRMTRRMPEGQEPDVVLSALGVRFGLPLSTVRLVAKHIGRQVKERAERRRDRFILARARAGDTNKMIGDALGLHPVSVSRHVRRVMKAARAGSPPPSPFGSPQRGEGDAAPPGGGDGVAAPPSQSSGPSAGTRLHKRPLGRAEGGWEGLDAPPHHNLPPVPGASHAPGTAKRRASSLSSRQKRGAGE